MQVKSKMLNTYIRDVGWSMHLWIIIRCALHFSDFEIKVILFITGVKPFKVLYQSVGYIIRGLPYLPESG